MEKQRDFDFAILNESGQTSTGFRAPLFGVSVLGLRFRVLGLWFGVFKLLFNVCQGFRVQGLGSSGLGFRV